ncbi:MAG: hypothetical protein MUC83_01220 [Pirellula sp.]|jgi:hypothetical protein|nr:hypothetical protein [Pirellula sp.]
MYLKLQVFGLIGMMLFALGCDFGQKEALMRIELEKAQMQLQQEVVAANQLAKSSEAARLEIEQKLQDAMVAREEAERAHMEAEKSRQMAMVSQKEAEQKKEEVLKANEVAAIMKKENETLRAELEQTKQLLEKALARIAELEKDKP